MQLQPPWHHMVPFLASVVASCIWFVPKPVPSVGSMTLKCLPVILLATYLFYLERWAHREADFVFVALILSALGDAYLVFPKTLGLFGVIAFGLAQLAYIYAFGFSSINWVLGGILYGVVIVLAVAVLLTVKVPENYRMAIPVPILYAVLIITMLWRALDRYHLKEELSIHRRLCTSLGGVFFVFSDLSIVLLQGAQLIPQPYSKLVTMLTYYLAQLLITLGATDTFWTANPAGTCAARDDNTGAPTSAVTTHLSSISTFSNPIDDTIQSSPGELTPDSMLQSQEPSEIRRCPSNENSSTISLPEQHSSTHAANRDRSDSAPETGKTDLDSSTHHNVELERTNIRSVPVTGMSDGDRKKCT